MVINFYIYGLNCYFVIFKTVFCLKSSGALKILWSAFTQATILLNVLNIKS